MTELQLQILFSQEAALLIQQAGILGYGVTLGEAWRSPEQAAWDAAHGTGVAHSLHTEKLAVDLNLFKRSGDASLWTYITDDEGHRDLGAWWKGRGSSHCWGGDFSKQDPNHYSISPDGVRK
jgi:hypothetical protein